MSPTPKSLGEPEKLGHPSTEPKLESDSLPPVQFRHLLLDMANVTLCVVLFCIPITHWHLVSHIVEDDPTDVTAQLKMCFICFAYTSIQYWILSGFFYIIEQLGLCHDMFVFSPKQRLSNEKIVKQVLSNQFWAGLFICGATIIGWRIWPSTFDRPPTPWEVFKFTFFCSCIHSEFVFYCGHRLLHTKRFMIYHKTHHEMNNATNVAAWGARYCSLVEDILCNILAICCGTFFHCLHPVYICYWVSHAQWNVICNHTGYHEKFLPVSAALTGMIHHNHHRNGNADFGTTVGWADWLFGTKGSHHPGSVIVTALDFVWTSLGGKSRL